MTTERDTNVPDEIRAYYNLGNEAARLKSGPELLEYVRTQELIQRSIPPTARVLDIGGGAGIYAFWLAEAGYEVHLIDAMALHVEQANARNKDAVHSLASIQVGDARHLNQEDKSADVVLMFGPLYHLIIEGDRNAALREAFRVLKPGGTLFAAAISRFASLLDSISQNRLGDAEFARVVEADLVDGQHRNPSGVPSYFTTAYLHHPDELAKEVSSAGFTDTTLFAIEGPGWLHPNFDDVWNDQAQRDKLLQFVKTVETEPTMMGVSAHLMAIGRKPEIPVP